MLDFRKELPSSDSSDSDYVALSSHSSSPKTSVKKVNFKNKENVEKVWEEMKKEDIDGLNSSKKDNKTLLSPLELASEIIQKHERELMEGGKTVVFAGSEYLIDKHGNLKLKTKENLKETPRKKVKTESFNQKGNNNQETQEKNKIDEYLEDLFERRNYLNLVNEKLNNRPKTINSMGKSKIDWEIYAKKQRIEQKLAQNRKNGILEKQNFLKKTS